MSHHDGIRTLVVLGEEKRRGTLRGLLEQARHARWSRTSATDVPDASLRAAAMIETCLHPSKRGTVGSASYFNRLATHQQIARRSIRTLQTAIDPFVLHRRMATAIATALDDTIHFVDSGAAGRGVDLYLAIGIDGDDFLLALGVRGDYQIVGTGGGASAIERAGLIAAAIGGTYSRGVDDDFMVFGMTVPVTSIITIGGRDRLGRERP